MGSEKIVGSENTWRGRPECLDPWREWIRRNIPGGPRGYVFEDVDLVARRFYIGDPAGRFMLIEFKYADSELERSQIWTFGLMDNILSRGDRGGRRYKGFYLVQYPEEDPWRCKHVTVNGVTITIDEFRRFLRFELDLPPYEFPDYVKGEV